MKFQPTQCVKCGSELERGRGRPSRFCCDGCKASAEAEMRRINTVLRKYEDQLAWREVIGKPPGGVAKVIGDMQKRFDHLAGVPPQSLPEDERQ
jgi:hypothetical protein